MKDFINELDNGLESIMYEKSSNVSGGEKQKISILKVLLKQPDVMIFDEPTSALDSESAYNFISHLMSLKKEKLIILVTHDEEIKKNADVIIAL